MEPEQIQKEWKAALDDAAFTDDECVVFLSDLPPKTGRGAQWWEPGMTIEVAADDDLATEDLAAEANSPQHRNRHRVIVRGSPGSDPASIAAFSGMLRHELEHARQWNACGPPVFQLSELADAVLQPKLVGLAGGRVFTNLKPTEQDANAASAMLLLARWPEAITELLDDRENAPLARSLTPPGSFETLVRRMVAFLYLYEDLCAALAAHWAIGFADYLDEIAPGAGTVWRTLESTNIEAYWGSGGPPTADTAWDG